MSTVKATHFEHPSASTPGITLASDGSVVLPAGFTGGLGTNVVQTVKTDTFSTTTTSFADVTGMTVTITPTSASSKILVIVNATIHALDGTNAIFARLARGGSAIYVGDAAGNRTVATWDVVASNNSHMIGGNMVYLDSPATTSATTYSFQMRTGNGTIYLNRGGDDSDNIGRTRGASSITAIEVAA